jgi:tubulin polyglutamylase TTLL1
MLKENLLLDILPHTFLLPVEYSLFIEEFHRQQSTWIVKPSNKSQGKGIFLINNAGQIKKLVKELQESKEISTQEANKGLI